MSELDKLKKERARIDAEIKKIESEMYRTDRYKVCLTTNDEWKRKQGEYTLWMRKETSNSRNRQEWMRVFYGTKESIYDFLDVLIANGMKLKELIKGNEDVQAKQSEGEER